MLRLLRNPALLFLCAAALPKAQDLAPMQDSTARVLASSKLSGWNSSPAWKHAPLMIFSVGSLATVGAIYGLKEGSESREGFRKIGGSGDFDLALAMAGATALVAAGAYIHYVRRDNREQATWSAAVVPDTGGEFAFAAFFRLRFQVPGS